MVRAASSVAGEARRDWRWERTMSRLSERVRESREEGMVERERRLLIVGTVSVVEKRAVRRRCCVVGALKAADRRVRAMRSIVMGVCLDMVIAVLELVRCVGSTVYSSVV